MRLLLTNRHRAVVQFIVLSVIITLAIVVQALSYPIPQQQRMPVTSLRRIVDTAKPLDALVSEVRSPLPADIELLWLSMKVSTNLSESTQQSWAFHDNIEFNENEMICIYRWKIWWAIPKLMQSSTATAAGQVPPETYLILGRLADSSYVALISAIDHGMGFSFEGSQSAENRIEGVSSRLIIHGHDSDGDHQAPSASSADDSIYRKAVVIGRGSDPFAVIEAALDEVKSHIRSEMKVEEDSDGDHDNRNDAIDSHDSDSNDINESAEMQRGLGPEFADYFGWCTWDSFYTDLATDRVLQGLDSFKHVNVTPRFLILDDGWQDTTVNDRVNGHQWFGRLVSFSANFKFAPGYDGSTVCHDEIINAAEVCSTQQAVDPRILPGSVGIDTTSRGHSLKSLVSAVKNQMHVKNFFVWHTLTGYWAGVEPASQSKTSSSSDLAEYNAEITFASLPPSVMRMSEANALIREPFTTDGVGIVDPNHVERFFSDYHRSLRAMGVDGVKVDAQSVLPALSGSRGGGWHLTKAYHKALYRSVTENFGAVTTESTDADTAIDYPIIHCMCHSQSTLLAIAALYSKGKRNSHRRSKGGIGGRTKTRHVPVVRGSDDFWPTNSASHGPHIFANAMNSILFSHIGLHDWDMFQSSLGRSSELHAVARAVSGGPVYVSDQPLKHDATVLRQLAFPNGLIPRCLRNALPSPRTLFRDPQREVGVPLVIQNINAAGSFVVAAFSIAGAVLENDLDHFRFLSPEEMKWPPLSKVHSRLDTVTDASIESGQQQILAVYENPLYQSLLEIRTNVSLWDVSEFRRSRLTANGDDTAEYVAFRYSDKKVFLLSSAGSARTDSDLSVPIVLPAVFDNEVVSFSPRRLLREGTDSPWAAVIGAVDKYNSGGAVRSVRQNLEDTPSGMSASLLITVLGPGKYWIVTDTIPRTVSLVDASSRAAASLGLRMNHQTIATEEAEECSGCVVAEVEIVFDGEPTNLDDIGDMTIRMTFD